MPRLYGVFVFQRSGNVLDAMYFNGTTPTKAADLTALTALAQLTGKRLAAATSTTV